jgi:hypothetical protein
MVNKHPNDFFADSLIYGRAYRLNILKSHIIGNSATTQCAGIRIEHGDKPYSLADVMIDGCVIEENHSDVYSPLRIAGNFEDFEVSNTVIKNNTTLRWAGGAGFLGGCTGEVSNCLILSNYAYYSEGKGTMNGVAVGNGSKVSFFNCTFSDTSQAGGYGLSMRRNTRVYLTNCILWSAGNNPVYIETMTEPGCELFINFCAVENGMDSLYVSDSLSVVYWGDGNIESDPLFTDPAAFDYHLQSTSRCIGTGVNCLQLSDEWQCAPTFDMEGRKRPYPDGSECDMGAYEHELGMPLVFRSLPAVLPESFNLFQNYPNPFNPKTVIRYQLPVPCHTNLCIYNLLGQKVATLVSGEQPPGYYEFSWDASGLPSGIYFCRLETEAGFLITRKMMLLQ